MTESFPHRSLVVTPLLNIYLCSTLQPVTLTNGITERFLLTASEGSVVDILTLHTGAVVDINVVWLNGKCSISISPVVVVLGLHGMDQRELFTTGFGSVVEGDTVIRVMDITPHFSRFNMKFKIISKSYF